MRSLYLVTAILVLWMSNLARADAAADYQTLFGQDEKAASRNVKEAAPFAAKLLTAAKAVGDQKGLQEILCEKAFSFGVKDPAGYPTAIDAMKLLMEAAPQKKPKARESLLKVFQLRYARSTGDERKRFGDEMLDILVAGGDEELEAQHPTEATALYRQALNLAAAGSAARTGEIMDKIKQVTARGEAQKIRGMLVARLEKDPKDLAARKQLILVYLCEYGTTAEAEKLLTDDVDKDLRERVLLATRQVGELDEAECVNLAEWYSQLAGKSSVAGKAALLANAAACCERYLMLHPALDADRLKALKLLENASRLPGASPSMPGPPRLIILDIAQGVSMKLMFIPAGEFLMGSPTDEPGRVATAEVQHKVKLTRAYYLGATEVTQAQWIAVMGDNPSHGKGDNRPVENLSADDAIAFCKKLSDRTGKRVRLPTEAEWEYACRAGATTAYNTGTSANALAEAGWYTDNSNNGTHPVGKKKPNAWGLYDMHGNALEWCSDYGRIYPAGLAVDPTGPIVGTERVLRGGSWFSTADQCRSASRFNGRAHFNEPNPNVNIGFRAAMEVPPASLREK